jgi:organic radical activating enzyme
MKKKINEIFYSIQGEGQWAGTPMIFVRFSGCNLTCSFCDTEHQSFAEMTTEEIINAISLFPAKRVCLTGGEPSMQIDDELIGRLKNEGYLIHIETNGTQTLPCGIDWVTISPKTDKVALSKANEIKIIYQGEDVSKWLDYPADYYCLQPCSCKNTAEVIAYILEHPQWNLSVQTHKYLNIQ